MGIVENFGFAVKRVAPNSPRLIVNANKAPTVRDLLIIGRSTHNQEIKGDAPSSDAAFFKELGMDIKAGIIDLKTKGKATRVWAIGTSINEVLKFKGGLSRVIIIPNPRVTAEVEMGSIKRGSNTPPIFPFKDFTKNPAQTPRIIAETRVITPYIKEFVIKALGGI